MKWGPPLRLPLDVHPGRGGLTPLSGFSLSSDLIGTSMTGTRPNTTCSRCGTPRRRAAWRWPSSRAPSRRTPR